MTRKGLIVFAREPLPGRVKTRLASAIGDSAAAELYEAMLQDVLSVCSRVNQIDTVVFWDCAEDSMPLLESRFSCRSGRQADGNLGQRMQNAFNEMFDRGYEICCIIGSDCPDLPAASLTDAFSMLESGGTDAVFGPSLDGGYYLLGLRSMIPGLFENIAWSTDVVLRQSLAAAKEAGLTTSLLNTWQDIDTLEDLKNFLERTDPHSVTGYQTALLAGKFMSAGMQA